MTLASRYGWAALAMVRRDLTIFFSYRLRLISQLLSGLFSLVTFYYVSRLVQVGVFESSDDYFAFVVVGLATFAVLTSTISGTAGSIRQELVAGTFERLVVSPFGAVASIVSMMLFPLLYAIANAAVTLALATIIFGLPLEWPSAALAAPVALLGASAFVPFGILIAAAVVVVKQAASLGSFIIASVSLVAGFYFPVALLPDSIQWMSEVQPFTPALELLRHLLVGAPLSDSAAVILAKLAGFAVVLVPASVCALSAAMRVARRRGTVIEY